MQNENYIQLEQILNQSRSNYQSLVSSH
jgi:hypothetical protein